CNNNPKPPVIKDTTSPIPETPEIKKQTVLIIGTSPSSGVIISSKDNQYYILTAKHNVEDIPSDMSDSYKVETYDGEQYKVDYTKVKQDPILDLAIVEFTSDKKYPVARLSKDLKRDANVSISGWKDCFKPEYEFNKGQVLQVISSSSEVNNNKQSKEQEYEDEDFQNGYIVEYTNTTMKGMSGSPVFNDTDHVVAIHARSGHRKEYNSKECKPLTQDFSNNWGIPIEKFLQSSLSSGISLKEDNIPIPESSPTSNLINELRKTPSSDLLESCIFCVLKNINDLFKSTHLALIASKAYL
ncbi:MAG: serine protease, partial [Dolichospermum sp.]